MTNSTKPFGFATSIYPWLIVACGMLFYCFNYFLRVSPSVMQGELTHSFHITATQFGTLAAFYYYAYTPMQIPAGMLYDKFGVRVVICVACLLATLGLGVFISADSYALACLGRFMIGLGSAFAFIGTLKLASVWLPPYRFATVAALATAVGMISGALAQTYLTHIIAVIGYKQALQTALFAGVALSIFLVVLVRNNGKHAEIELHNPMNLSQLLSALRLIFSNPQMWLIGLIGSLFYLPSSVFLDLWGIPYLEAVYHLTPEQAVQISSYTFYGWIISGPIIGIVSDKIRRRRSPLIIAGMFATLLLCGVFYFPDIAAPNLGTIFFLIGVSCGAQPLCFALGKESNPIEVSGTAVAVTNMLIMAGGVICQPLVGKILDLHTQSPLGLDGLPVYTANDYTFALSIVPIGVALGIVFLLFLKETFCEQTEEKGSGILVPATEAGHS